MGPLCCEPRRLAHQRADAANQIDEKPESDNRHPSDREGRKAPIVDQVSAIECRMLFDLGLHDLASLRRVYIGQIGRTSIAPCCAAGHRAAHEIAASRSGASIRKYPPNCSLTSA
jgi:hypothetical protein